MNDLETSRLLERLAETFPDQPAPLQALLAASRGARRDRNRKTIASGVAVISLVFGGGVIVQQAVSDGYGRPKSDSFADAEPNSQKQVTVPDLVGKDASAAVSTLHDLGFETSLDTASIDPAAIIASMVPGPGTVVRAGERIDLALANNSSCPTVPKARALADPATVPAPEGAQVMTNADDSVAAWFERPQTLPVLVVYDLDRKKELVREDLGVGEDERKASLRVGTDAVYFQSSADPQVWLWSRWEKGLRYPSVYEVCS